MENREVLCITSKVKKYLKEEHQLKCASDIPKEISNSIYELLDAAAEDAKQKKQKTLLVKNL